MPQGSASLGVVAEGWYASKTLRVEGSCQHVSVTCGLVTQEAVQRHA